MNVYSEKISTAIGVIGTGLTWVLGTWDIAIIVLVMFMSLDYILGLADFLSKILRSAGCMVDVIICPEKQFAKSTEERTYKLSRINGKKYDLVIELHLNSYNGSAKGTEVLYCSNTGKMYAQRVVNKLGTVFTSRQTRFVHA